MKIHDDHLYHGAALIQIAEHPQFTAINSLTIHNKILRSAYKINDHIGVYLKYCVNPTESFDEYTFTFNSQHLEELTQVAGQVQKLILVMVCVKVRSICYVKHDSLLAMIERRREKKGEIENQYIVKVTAPKGRSMRVYMDYPGKKKTILGKALIVPWSKFPAVLFK